MVAFNRSFTVLKQFNQQFIDILSDLPFLHHHFKHPTSELITITLIYVLIIILIYLSVRSILLHYKIIDLNKDEQIFIDKPIHVAHITAYCKIYQRDQFLKDTLKFKIEFSPEDYDYEDDDELGSTLALLKRKLYHLFKVSNIYEAYDIKDFTINDVEIYHGNGLLTDNDKALCLLGVQTGDIVKVKFNCN
ncbi:hypothetical protein WICMUC_001078 [Wickerhamomyces mucosus]|uniref:Ubiquitin-like domain-containing protein n=1 Tax=Wickerhamomyces mucosus TaxID=1378264 RepID=A0A9P8TH38_9ASCO|nr:hypothetical protein WICMUC_001078 [Wickerhamomyces mucosus]